MRQKHSLVLVAILAACMFASAGCSPGTFSSAASDRETKVVMSVLSIFYGEYLESHRGRPPKDNAAFREYLESRPDDLKLYHVENPDQLLTSPRDGQPLVIVCGKRIAPADSPGTPWAAYEQEGIGGKRFAVKVRGGAPELSAEEFAQIFGQ